MAKIPQIVLDDCRIKVRQIAEIMNMSKERVCHILNQHLGRGKLSTRCEPRLLTLDQKRVRMSISNALLEQLRCNKSKFWHRLITVDETWIHHYMPKTKIQSKHWTAKGEPAPKKAKTVIWDSHGVILIDYLQKGKTLTFAYYAYLLDKLKAEFAEKRPLLKQKKILFHQNNAPSHTSVVAMTKIHELRRTPQNVFAVHRSIAIDVMPTPDLVTLLQYFTLAHAFLCAHLSTPGYGNPAVIERHQYPLLNLFAWNDRQLLRSYYYFTIPPSNERRIDEIRKSPNSELA
ncbi:histone-lysine N-methyltransferase SETMAR [Trichonephila clavipes]|nr:histone-lysine N-methyltransferase SETMAR [Trichonephila clavipes]